MIGHLSFDTSLVAPADRFEFWRERVQPLRLEPLATTPFDVTAEVLRNGDVKVIEMRRGPAAASWTREIGEAQARLRLIVLAPSAGGAASWYGTPRPLDRGGVTLSGASTGWWRAPAGMHGIEVDVPRVAVDVSDSALARAHEQRRIARDPVFRTLIRPMLTGMAGHLRELADTAGSDLGTAWTSLLTMLLRSLGEQDLDSADLAPARRIQAQRHIRCHLGDPRLSPDTVAAALHVSRRALYEILPGPAAYIRAQRLARAHELLASSRLPVGAVATMVGLPDPAHFSRLFRAAYGQSPTDARATTAKPR